MIYESRDYDFLDFGASQGGSIDFSKKHLGGRCGLGIDSNPAKVEWMRGAGYDCMEADVLDLDLPQRSVRFVTMNDFLEHLPDLDAVARAISVAANVSSHFLFIARPYFDADDYLEQRGLKFYWSDWPNAHPCHLTSTQLRETLHTLELPDYLIFARQPVFGSWDASIHPLSSPYGQHDYDPNKHPAKPVIAFSPPLYREMVCAVRLRPFRGWSTVLRARPGLQLIAGTLPYEGPSAYRNSSSLQPRAKQ